MDRVLRHHATRRWADRFLLVASCVAALTLSLCQKAPAVEPAAVAQGPANPANADAPKSPIFTEVRKGWSKGDATTQSVVENCAKCHIQRNAATAGDATSLISRLNEVTQWIDRDKHAIARWRIEPLPSVDPDQSKATPFGKSNQLSRVICDRLGYDVATEAGYAKFRDNCLSCHGGYDGATSTEAAWFDREGWIQPGVSCAYCHGEVTRDPNGWYELHQQTKQPLDPASETWCAATAAMEKSAAGMRDLTNDEVRGNLCADCHVGRFAPVGSGRAHRFVSHAMYVAGHPPLPSFELSTFCDQSPRHWRRTSELISVNATPAQKNQYLSNHFPTPLANDLKATKWDAREAIVGAIVAKTAATQLLADIPEGQWGDYGLYDCSACHHELRLPSLRQWRGYVAAPGRPRLPEWSDSILQTFQRTRSIKVIDRAIFDRIDALAMTISQEPFGDPAVAQPAAIALLNQLRKDTQRALELPITDSVARDWLKQLLISDTDELIEFHAARQRLWAANRVAFELSEGNPKWKVVVDGLRRAADRAKVRLRLPAGQVEGIFDNLGATLDEQADYKPRILQQEIQSQIPALRKP
jgi:hypothetical protein